MACLDGLQINPLINNNILQVTDILSSHPKMNLSASRDNIISACIGLLYSLVSTRPLHALVAERMPDMFVYVCVMYFNVYVLCHIKKLPIHWQSSCDLFQIDSFKISL